MRFKSRLCLLTLCAFALLLGLVTAGCSSQDREGSKQAITTKTITYSYTKSVLKGVPSTAEYIYVAAYDANNNELYSALQNNDEHDAWAGYDASSSTYNAVTVVDIKTDHMLYTFTYIDEESGSEVEAFTSVVTNVTDIKDGESTQSSDEVEFTCKFYGSDGEELPADKVTVDDQFSVRVFAKVDTAEQDISDSFDSLTFAPAELLEEGTAWTYTAKAEGTVKFSAEIEDMEYRDIGSITIVPKEIPGEPALYLCPAGWSVANGKLLNDQQEVVEDATAIPSSIEDGVKIGATYTFVVAYKSAEGTFADVSSEAELNVEPEDYVTIDGMNMTAVQPGDITVTAAYGELESTNNLICNLCYEEKIYLCPAGYSVVEGKLYDNASAEVTSPESIPEEISGVFYKDNFGDTPYTFVVVLRQKDGSYIDKSNVSSLSVSPSDGISFEGCKMSLGEVDDVGYGQHFVSAQVDGYETSFPLNFEPDKYTYKGYICPKGYYVNSGKLYDQDGSEVALAAIPSELTLAKGSTYEFTSAMVNREDTIVSGASCYVESSQASVVACETQSREIRAVGVGQAVVKVVCEADEYNMNCQNSITVTVEEPELYICPQGYKVENGNLINDKLSRVLDPEELNDLNILVDGGDEYAFVLVSYANGTWSYYQIAGTGYYALIDVEGEAEAYSDTSGTLTIPGALETYGEGSAYIGTLEEETKRLSDQISENKISLSTGE